MIFGEEGGLMAEEITKPTDAGRNGLRKWGRLGNSSPYAPYERELAEQLRDAEQLLNYAIETGTKIADDVREAVLNAKATITDKWDKQTAMYVLSALTSL